jgi:VWFA-related protein
MALVTVIADATGPIRDLKAQDFVVTEDNQKRRVVSAELAEDPLSIVLLVDTATPPPGLAYPTQDLRTSIAAFAKAVHARSPEAKISIADFGGAAVTRLPFTSKGPDIDAAIGKLYQNPQSQAVLIEAIVDASKQLGEQPPPRRAIVSIDFNSSEASADRSMKPAVEAAHKAGVTLWPVSVRGTAASPPNREEVLNKITQANGGLRLTSIDASGLQSALQTVANSLGSQYSVTFERPGGGTPKTTRFETTRGAKVQRTPWMR